MQYRYENEHASANLAFASGRTVFIEMVRSYVV